MAKVLIVEDEAPLREALAAYLRREGLDVVEAGDGEAGWRAFREGAPDLVVLDRKLPLLAGEDLCRRIKGLGTTPVVMATSLIQEEAALEGFALGADDYVRKPYSVKEMAARIAVRLRSGAPRKEALEVPGWNLRLDLGARTAWAAGKALPLTPHEFDLLAGFAARPDRVLSRADLLTGVWADREEVSDRAVDSHVKNLRAKLKTALGAEPPLETVYGRGYRWSP